VKTAVQLRSDGSQPGDLACELGCGKPHAVTAGARGPVALFEAGEIVAYLVRSRSGGVLFVFRTLSVDDPWAARVPGVHPRVRLLLHVRSATRMRAMKRLFAHLDRHALRPSDLSDGFYVRVSHAVGGRTDQARLRALLRRELGAQGEGRAGAAGEGRA